MKPVERNATSVAQQRNAYTVKADMETITELARSVELIVRSAAQSTSAQNVI